jgi:hypothetical protein
MDSRHSRKRLLGGLGAADGWNHRRTLVKVVAPFLVPLRMRVERRQDLANMMGELLFSWRKGGKLADK